MNNQQANTKPLGDLFGYLQLENLNLVAWALLLASWTCTIVATARIDTVSSTTWVPILGVVTLACLLARWLSQYRYRLAAMVLVTLLLVADGIALRIFQSGQILYFAVPVIGLANYLIGPLAAGVALGGVILMAGVGLESGVPMSDLVGPVALGILTILLGWLSSRYLYTTLQWAWSSHLHSLKLADEAQRHRGELATASKALEEAYQHLSKLNDAFAEAWRIADEAKQFKAQFAANISHELRTPLYIIVGFSETMLLAPESYGPELPAAYRSDLMEIYNSSRHLLGLIDDVLDLSQIEAGRMGFAKEPTDMAEVIRESVDLVHVLADRKGLSLEMLIQEPLPTLKLDRIRIRQVLLNLLNNAARYTDHGTITVEARAEGAQLLISVADTGPGIPAEYLEKVFESFYQVDGSPSRRHGGAGLGLAISKYFVEMHEGRIWVESQPGVGSRFFFSLPLPAETLEKDHTQGRLHHGSPPLFNRADANTVLLIHPDPAIAHLLERHLDSYQVIHASDAAAAEQQLKTLRPRAIIVGDHQVPGEEESDASMPTAQTDLRRYSSLVSVLSANMTGAPFSIPLITCPLPSGLRPALALGVRGYLVKPVSKERLLSTLAQCAPQARHILVVDDDPRVVRLLTRVLLSIPGRYQVISAFDGQEALTLMRAERPDLVLLDLYMPEPDDGFTVLDHMAADPSLAQLPVVVVSAKGLPEDKVFQLQSPITVNRPDGFALAELFKYLQSILDASGPQSRRGSPTARSSVKVLPG